MKTTITICALLISMISVAQSTSSTQYGAYLTVSKSMWERSIDQAKVEKGETSLEVALAMYGLLNNTMATQDEETFDAYKDVTIEILEALMEENPDWGEPKAVLSSVYGLAMAYSPWKGIFLGAKSSSLIAEAMKLQPESPLVQKLYAGSKLHTPKTFGGDPLEAVKAYQTSLSLFEEESTRENWLYLDTMMGLAMAYEKTEQHDKAIAILREAIEIEPAYGWAKATLAEYSKS